MTFARGNLRSDMQNGQMDGSDIDRVLDLSYNRLCFLRQ
jgi:uncharacterized protein involved in outer membrane biogenesis